MLICLAYRYSDCSPTDGGTASYDCSLPGKIHGHKGISLSLFGKTLTYIVFGGEKSDIKQPSDTTSTAVLRYADLHLPQKEPCVRALCWIKESH